MRSLIGVQKHRSRSLPKASCMQLLKALSCRRRMNILVFLQVNRFAYVHSIAEHFNVSLESTSQHLRILRNAHLVKTKKKGLYVQYSLSSSLPNIVKVSIKEYLRNYSNN